MSTPSASIVNVFPCLDGLPGPMPWRTRANAFRKRDGDLYAHLVREALSRKAAGMTTYVREMSTVQHTNTDLCRWAAIFSDENIPEGDQSRLMNQFSAVRIPSK